MNVNGDVYLIEIKRIRIAFQQKSTRAIPAQSVDYRSDCQFLANAQFS
jgi:hypothetical protein